MIVSSTQLILGEESLEFLQNDYIFFGSSLLCKFLVFTVSFFAGKKIGKVNLGMTKGLSFLFVLQPLTAVFVIMIIYKCTYLTDGLSPILFSVAAFTVILGNVATMILVIRQKEYIETKDELKFAEGQIKNQISHYEELYASQNELRTFKHDIKNKLLGVCGLLKNSEIDEALKTLNGDLEFITANDTKVINSGNAALDAVLQSKISTAKKKNIDVKCSLKLTEDINIPFAEFASMLGNAIDNATEATEKIGNEENRTVHITVIGVNGRISVCVENPLAEKIDTEKFTTEKADKINHGYGIKSIQTVARKYGGAVFFSTGENFRVSINIPNTFA